MPARVIKSFSEPIFTQLLRNPIVGTVDISAGADVSGLTLIFTTPGTTVTFTGTNPLSPTQISSQIMAAVSAVEAQTDNFGANGSESLGKKFLSLASRTTSAITLAGNGTANAVLGLPSVASTAQDVTPASVIHCNRDLDGYFRAIVVA